MSGFDVEIKNIRHLLLGAHVVVENTNLLVLFCFVFFLFALLFGKYAKECTKMRKFEEQSDRCALDQTSDEVGLLKYEVKISLKQESI